MISKTFPNRLFRLGCRLICLFSVFGCGSIRPQGIKLVKLAFVTNLPELNPDGYLINYRDSVPIYYYDNLVLYKMPYLYEERTPVRRPGKDNVDTVNLDKIAFTETRYIYFVYKRDQQKGMIIYDLSDLNSRKTASVDSIRSYLFYGNSDVYATVKNENLYKTYGDPKKGNLVQVLIPKIERDDGDTCYLYYSKDLKFSDLSFSKTLDSIAQLKLYKFKVICNKKKSLLSNAILPQREFFYELKRVPASIDDKSVESLFLKVKDEKLLDEVL